MQKTIIMLKMSKNNCFVELNVACFKNYNYVEVC